MTDENEKNFDSYEFELRRYEARLGLWKVILGTLIVGLAGILIPGAIEYWSLGFQERRAQLEMAVEQEKNRQDFVSSYVTTALNEDIELRIRFAEYFAAVADDGSVSKWQGYLRTLQAKRESVRTQIDEFEAKVRSLYDQMEGSPSIELQIKIALMERRLEWLYREIGYVQRGRSIVPSNEERSSNATDEYTQTVVLSDRRGVNLGLTPTSQTYLLEKFGRPRQEVSDFCQPITNERLAAVVRTEQVGPIRATLLAPAITSLRRVFDELEKLDPVLYSLVGTAGSLCVRSVRGSTVSITNHGFGSAIDLTIGGTFDTFGDGRTQKGLILIAELFHKEGWIWGAGFTREESMHFEVSKELLDKWFDEGLLPQDQN